jgi:hypothetical protein
MSIQLSTAGVTMKYAVEATSGTRPTTGYTEVPELKAIPEMNRFINVHALQPCILIDTFLPYAFRRKVLFNDPDIAVPVLIPSHSNGKIIGTFPFKQFRQRNYISTVTLEFFANSSSVITRWAYAVWL